MDLSQDELMRLSEIYKLFGNTSRLKILLYLAKGENSVNKISDAIGISQSATSHQLKDLKNCKIIKSQKSGLNVYYSLDDDHILKMLENGADHIKGENCHES